MNGKKNKVISIVLTVLMLINMVVVFPTPTFAALTGITLAANVTANAGSATVIDPSLTLTGSGNLSGATVIISENFNSATDSLTYGATGGLTASYNNTTGILTVSGTADISVYQAFLRTVAYNTSGGAGTRKVNFSLSFSTTGANPIYNTPTQHYYEFVVAPSITWTQALAAAALRDYNGMQGYLATITSQEENDFIAARCLGSGWLGASDASSEGDWKWVTGPETGTSFWSGGTAGSAVGGLYNEWKSGLEPNDGGGSGEDYLHIMGNPKPGWAGAYAIGDWNDFPDVAGANINGYVVEYGNQTIGDSGVTISTFSATTTITIQDKAPPTVSTGAVTNNATGTSVTLGGNVTADGNDAITERGVCYSTSANPTTASMKVTSAGTTGAFTVNVASLTEGTTYHYRAYAINSSGTSYGNDATFTTPTKPSVTTSAATGITVLAATLNGNITSDGGSAVTERGFYYHTATNPKVGGTKIAVAGTTGAFTSTPVLSPGTRYYYIAFGTNVLGSTDGSEQSFTTLLASPVTTLTPDTTSIEVTWAAITNATSYDIYIDGSGTAVNTTETRYTHTGLTPNTSHTYRVVAKNAVSQSSGDIAKLKYTLAEVPVISKTETKQDGSVILTLDKQGNSGATQYFIEKSQTADFSSGITTVQSFAAIAANTLTVLKHSTVEANGVLPATTYYFRIKAKNGEDVETIYDTTVTGSLTVPEIPVISAITPQFDPDGYSVKQNKIDWNSVNGATSYDVFSGTGVFIASVPGGTTTYTHLTPSSSSGGLVPNTSYSYKVVARNAGTPGIYDDGCSVYSGTSSEITLATIPDVDEMKALANGNVTLKIDEKDNPNNTEYYVLKSTSPLFTGATEAVNWTNPGNDHLVTVTGLNRGTTYYFKVKARNSDLDETAYGNITGYISTIPADILVAPVVTVTSTTQLSITWNAATGATSYDLYYQDGTFFKNVTGTTTTDSGLNPNTPKRYYVKGKNSSGQSLNQSPTSTIKYTLAAKPDLTLMPQPNGDVVVTVVMNNNLDGTQYFIQYGTAEDFTGAATSAYGVTTLRTLSGLTHGTTYYFRVKAMNGDSIETAYSTSKSTMTALEIPVINAGTSSVDGTNHKVTVTWDAIASALNYKVYRDGVLLGTTSATTFTDTSLKANRIYTYTVKAVNAAGEGLPSVGYDVRTLAEYPVEIIVSDKKVDAFTLNLTQHQLVANSQKYKITIKKTSDQTLVRTLSWSSDLIYEITDLAPGTEYDVYVDVRNSDDVGRGDEKMLTLYCNRPVNAIITNDADVLVKETADGKFEIKLKVWDPDQDKVTVTVTFAGLTRTIVVDAPATEPADANVTLAWDIYSLPEDTYTPIPVTVTDGNDSTLNLNFTHTLTVDKTGPVITLTGASELTIEVGDVYTDQGATVVGDDGNGVATSGDDFDSAVLGTYTVTYTASDIAGNTTTVTRTVHVVEGITESALQLNIATEGVGKTSAVFSGGLTTLGKETALLDHGFAYSLTPISDITDPGVTKVSLGAKTNLDDFVKAVNTLTEGTEYFVRAYVEKADTMIILSEEKSFTTLEITDTDIKVMYFNPVMYRTIEGGLGTVTVTVERSGDVTGAEMVEVALTGGDATGATVLGAGVDFTNVDLNIITVSFAGGEVAKTFDLTITNDAEYEQDETAVFTLQNPTAGVSLIQLIATVIISSEDASPAPSSAKTASSFKLAGIDANIDDVLGKITLTVPFGTDLTDITPDVFGIPAGATLSPTLSQLRDFSVPIAYTIIAEDGTVRRYIIDVTVAPQSSVNTLDDVVIETNDGPLTMTPVFSKDTLDYELDVDSDEDEVSINLTKDSPESTIVYKVNGVVDPTPESLSLQVGVNVITVEVTAANGEKKTYTFTITRAPEGTNANANLVNIALSTGTLSPAFAQNTIDYNVNVPNATAKMAITPTLSNPSASFTIIANGQVVASGTEVNLSVGANVFAVTVTATDGSTKTYAISVSRAAAASGGNGDSGNNGGNNGGGAPAPQPTTPTTPTSGGVDVLVNGKAENAGTADTQTLNNQTVTTIIVDQARIEKKLESEGMNALITIPVNMASDVIVGELNGQIVKNMESKQAVVEVKTANATYKIPAQEININSISQQIGSTVALSDIKVRIEIANPSASTLKIVENVAARGEFTIVGTPVDFTVKATYGDKEVKVSTFNAYVERMIAIPAGINPNRITTGVVIEPDGTVRHVPTRIELINGVYYAKINSLTNSVYSVVWNEVVFKDVEGHWAKTAINDMGSRMVVNGTGEGTYEPNRDITRGEFAAIVVRALGLKPGMGIEPYADVNSIDWFSDYVKTATHYSLISGYGNGSFGPNDKITREDAMVIISRAMKITALDAKLNGTDSARYLMTFVDEKTISTYAKESIAACVKTGLVNGRNGSLIAPKDFITRAEVAEIVRKLLQRSNLI